MHKDRGPSVIIPNIPKVIDEKARMKLMSDYDKYEPELFKHHIGTPETTQTIGLKFVPADFDRRVPTKTEPTLAERDYDARRRQRPPRAGVGTPFAQFLPAALPKAPAAPAATFPPPPTLASAAASVSTAAPPLPHVPPMGPQQRRRSQLEKQPPQDKPQPPQDKPQPPQDKQQPPQDGAAVDPSPAAPSSSPRRANFRPLRPPQRHTPSPLSQRVTLLSEDRSPRLASPSSLGDGMSAERCGILLRVLLDPPMEYSESFHLDLRHTDLRWMRTNRFPLTLTTLHNFRSTAQPINSPRSVLTLLRSGLVAEDLLPCEVRDEDVKLTSDLSGTSDDAELRRLAKRARQERISRRREEMLSKLHEEYATLCQRVALADVLKAFRARSLSSPAARASSADSASAVQRVSVAMREAHDRGQQSLLTARKQLERQMAFVRDVRVRRAEAEARQLQAAAEAQERAARKLEEERLARQRSEERQAQAREKAAAMEAVVAQRLAERQARAEERRAAQCEAAERLAESRRLQRAAQAAQREARVERQTAVLEAQREVVAQKAAEREAREAQRDLAQQRQTAAQRERAVQRAWAAEKLRDAARERQAQRDLAQHEAAERQRRVAAERLEAFAAQRTAAQQRRAAEEALREGRRREMRAQAEAAAAARNEVLAAEAERKEAARRGDVARSQEERVVRREGEREAAEEKAFQALRTKRAVEFEKLEGVYRLIAKREAVLALECKRERLHSATMRCREELMQEKDAMRAKFAKEAELLKRNI